MAKRSKSPQPPPEAPRLNVSRTEASNKIQKQINEGELLAAEQPCSEQELTAIKEKTNIWNDYNKELLRQLFTSPEIANEYSSFIGGVWPMNPSFSFMVEDWQKDVQTSINRLRSIFRRLELYPSRENDKQLPAKSRKRGAEIFIVHGRNSEAKETVARFLRRLKLSVIILHEQPDKGRTIIEKFEDHASVGYAVILLTGDDVGALKTCPDNLQPRARQNVVLEHGYFLGALGRTHVCALREEGVEIPTDLSGVLFIDFDANGAWKFKLATEIKAAGIEIDLNLVLQ